MNLITYLKKYQEGEKEAFEVIFEELEELFKFLKYRFNDEEIEEVILCLLPELLKKLNIERFNDDKHIKNYLKRCFENKAIDMIKIRYRENEIISYNTEVLNIEGNTINNSIALQSELEFNNIIKDLNKREKYIIEKFYKDRDSIIEIAKDLNLSRQFVNRV
ncbi:MAG: RNA polymerase sigma factor, partial [Clostridium sp.]